MISNSSCTIGCFNLLVSTVSIGGPAKLAAFWRRISPTWLEINPRSVICSCGLVMSFDGTLSVQEKCYVENRRHREVVVIRANQYEELLSAHV
jgi:hypothetical protein